MAFDGMGVADAMARLAMGNEPEPMESQPPNLGSRGVVAIDITEKFSQAVSCLEPGDIVKDGFFTLFESVAALEIMDPKMDSGCVAPGDEFDELYDVSRSLLPEEVLGIIDQLLSHEMAWHIGYPLSQTVFTSVYVEALLMPNPLDIDQAKFVREEKCKANDLPLLQVLRAYCLSMLKACGYVNLRVRSEHSYEEEDFVTNTYNRTLLDNISTKDIRLQVYNARKLLKTLRGQGQDDLIDALDARIRFRDIFLSATDCPQHIKTPELARAPWEEGLSLIKLIKESHPLGRPVDEAFSAKLQRKLASTVPPRPIVQLSFDDAFGHLTRLFQDGRDLIGVLNYTDSQCLQTFVSTFQSKKPQPLVYIRTLLQTFLFDAMEVLGSMSIRMILDDDLSIVTLPGSPWLDRSNDEVEAPQDPRFTMAQKMELFRQRAAQPFLDVLRTLCQNRSRVRRTLCHTVRAWDNLQVDAEEIDLLLHAKSQSRPSTPSTNPVDSYALSLSSWTYLYKLRQMESIVQLGFELQVYQADELSGMYWYLNYLAKSRLQHVERIKTFILRRIDDARPTTITKVSTNNQAQTLLTTTLQRSLAFTRLQLLDGAVTWELSDALSCLYTVLNRLNLIRTPPRPYSNDELRYELRMKPFAPIGLPELPTFEEFQAGTTQPDSTIDEIFDYGEKALAGAKKGYEVLSKISAEESFSVGSHELYMASVKNGLKSCIAAGLAISTVRKAIAARGGCKNEDGMEAEGDLGLRVEIPTPDKAYHEFWIVPKVTTV